MKPLKELHPLTFTFPSHRKYSWISASVFCFCVFFPSLLCSLKPPVSRGRWPLTLSLVLLEVSSCQKDDGVFVLHCACRNTHTCLLPFLTKLCIIASSIL
ncbi:hypothetical protein ATANTOWER_006436 [Ataeniobius toweri]|uniref:Uncharacterized protein n=1 Tax=Ataeniobius toweri TaxID=208326 RepID=A0ABU7B3T9_9TELE|nr:hypothetical protein [Ataeniobius toweri]